MKIHLVKTMAVKTRTTWDFIGKAVFMFRQWISRWNNTEDAPSICILCRHIYALFFFKISVAGRIFIHRNLCECLMHIHIRWVLYNVVIKVEEMASECRLTWKVQSFAMINLWLNRAIIQLHFRLVFFKGDFIVFKRLFNDRFCCMHID